MTRTFFVGCTYRNGYGAAFRVLAAWQGWLWIAGEEDDAPESRTVEQFTLDLKLGTGEHPWDNPSVGSQGVRR